MARQALLRRHAQGRLVAARREFKHGVHRGFVITRLADAGEVNALLDLARPRWLDVVLRVPDRWELLADDDEEENVAAPARDPVSCP